MTWEELTRTINSVHRPYNPSQAQQSFYSTYEAQMHAAYQAALQAQRTREQRWLEAMRYMTGQQYQYINWWPKKLNLPEGM